MLTAIMMDDPGLHAKQMLQDVLQKVFKRPIIANTDVVYLTNVVKGGFQCEVQLPFDGMAVVGDVCADQMAAQENAIMQAVSNYQTQLESAGEDLSIETQSMPSMQSMPVTVPRKRPGVTPLFQAPPMKRPNPGVTTMPGGMTPGLAAIRAAGLGQGIPGPYGGGGSHPLRNGRPCTVQYLQPMQQQIPERIQARPPAIPGGPAAPSAAAAVSMLAAPSQEREPRIWTPVAKPRHGIQVLGTGGKGQARAPVRIPPRHGVQMLNTGGLNSLGQVGGNSLGPYGDGSGVLAQPSNPNCMKRQLSQVMMKIKEGPVPMNQMVYDVLKVAHNGGVGYQCSLKLPTLQGYEEVEFVGNPADTTHDAEQNAASQVLATIQNDSSLQALLAMAGEQQKLQFL